MAVTDTIALIDAPVVSWPRSEKHMSLTFCARAPVAFDCRDLGSARRLARQFAGRGRAGMSVPLR
jgi:hypothetical protein